MSNSNSELLVLRFRDLSVEPGQTIVQHRRAIAAHDQCWWGWWARRQEINPKQMLSMLEYPREIALYDTDQARIYSAECLEARGYESEVLSPRPDWTPTYYNNRRLRAWFRFLDIEDASADLLISRRCILTANEAVENGWLIRSLDDLRRSETTMWLLSGGDNN